MKLDTNTVKDLQEDVGGNYLYHSVEDAETAKKILSSGQFNAGHSAQDATDAQVGDVPTVSFGRNLAYQLSGSNVGRDYQVMFVVNRNALEQRYKTIGTSQSGVFKGLGFGIGGDVGKNQNQDPAIRKKAAGKITTNIGILDKNKDGQISKDERSANPNLYSRYVSPKSGNEYEEVVPTKTGSIPWKNMLVGFYLVPGKEASKDPELLNNPLRLEMPRPNTFVRAKQGMTEESMNWREIPLASKEFVLDKFYVKFTPHGIEFYRKGELVHTKPGDFTNPTKRELSIARTIARRLWEKEHELESILELAGLKK